MCMLSQHLEVLASLANQAELEHEDAMVEPADEVIRIDK